MDEKINNQAEDEPERLNAQIEREPSEQPNQAGEGNPAADQNSNGLSNERTTEKPVDTKKDRPDETPGLKLAIESEQAWFPSEEIKELHDRLTAIQVQFVDEPCGAVEQSEAIVAETVERVKQMISDHQMSLSKLWLNNDAISTEELRLTLLHYRAFLNRLLKL